MQRLAVLGLAIAGCVGTSAAPPAYTPREPPADPNQGLNALTQESCWTPCADPLPRYANALRGSRGDALFLEVEPTHCQVPGFKMIPMECIATCDGRGLHTLTVDFGPVGETTQAEICFAFERERGSPLQGTCGDVCSQETGCSWDATPQRPEVKLMGHVEVRCAPEGEAPP